MKSYGCHIVSNVDGHILLDRAQRTYPLASLVLAPEFAGMPPG
jgi:hypothetical protein